MNKNLIILLLLLSCNTPEKYKVIGVVKEVNVEQNKLLIDHDDIPGFMVKMVMYFNIHESVEINNFTVNDSVSFELIIKDNNSYATNFKLLGKSSLTSSDTFWDDEEDEFTIKTIGETIDDATFHNTNNNAINLSDIESDFILISFIFSKCPMPNMCPASIIKNQYLANEFGNIQFLLISFDYLYDTPTVLNNVYGTLEKENLSFLSSYKHINDIYILTQQSGVSFWGVEENNIGHTMNTILVDKNLKLLKEH